MYLCMYWTDYATLLLLALLPPFPFFTGWGGKSKSKRAENTAITFNWLKVKAKDRSILISLTPKIPVPEVSFNFFIAIMQYVSSKTAIRLATCSNYFRNTILTDGSKTEFYYNKENPSPLLLLKLLLSSCSQKCIRGISKFRKKMLFYQALNNIPLQIHIKRWSCTCSSSVTLPFTSNTVIQHL